MIVVTMGDPADENTCKSGGRHLNKHWEKHVNKHAHRPRVALKTTREATPEKTCAAARRWPEQPSGKTRRAHWRGPGKLLFLKILPVLSCRCFFTCFVHMCARSDGIFVCMLFHVFFSGCLQVGGVCISGCLFIRFPGLR